MRSVSFGCPPGTIALLIAAVPGAGVDRLGVYLYVQRLGQAGEVVRVAFLRPVIDERHARSSLTLMAQLAWERERSYVPVRYVARPLGLLQMQRLRFTNLHVQLPSYPLPGCNTRPMPMKLSDTVVLAIPACALVQFCTWLCIGMCPDMTLRWHMLCPAAGRGSAMNDDHC